MAGMKIKRTRQKVSKGATSGATTGAGKLVRKRIYKNTGGAKSTTRSGGVTSANKKLY